MMDKYVFVKPGKEAHLVCNCSGYPPPQITWTFEPCSYINIWPYCIEQEQSSDDAVIRNASKLFNVIKPN